MFVAFPMCMSFHVFKIQKFLASLNIIICPESEDVLSLSTGPNETSLICHKKTANESNLLFFPHVQWISWISQVPQAYRNVMWQCAAASFHIAFGLGGKPARRLGVRRVGNCQKKRSSFGGKWLARTMAGENDPILRGRPWIQLSMVC